MDCILIVVNPNSGEKQAAEYGEALVDILNAKDVHNELYITSSKNDFAEVGEIIKRNTFDTVAILGGDGTISSFVNEIAVFEERPDILLLPLGTTNNLARALETDLDIEASLDKVQNNQLIRKKLDVGKINENYFISTVSAGSLPEVAWKADEDLKEKFGPFAYVLEGIKVLRKNESFTVKITTDEEEILQDDIQLIVIGLTNSVFGIPTFFKEGEIDDGRLYLFGLKSSDFIDEVSTVANFALWNDKGDSADTTSFTSKFSHAKIESASEMHLAVDGEKGPQFPIQLETLHNHLTFIVPEKD